LEHGLQGNRQCFQRDDAIVLIDVQVADKPASLVSLPSDLARRFGEAVIRVAAS
jgi:hypothetical protein